jgi:hypothetical protein
VGAIRRFKTTYTPRGSQRASPSAHNAPDFGSRCGSEADYARMRIRLVDDFRKAGHRIRRQISGELSANGSKGHGAAAER